MRVRRLFDVVTAADDPIEGWEAEGGYAPTSLPTEPAPAETSEPADAPAEVPAGELFRHRDDIDGKSRKLHAAERRGK